VGRWFKAPLVVFALSGLAAMPHTAKADRADDLFTEGNHAFAAKQYDEAYAKLHEAWTIRKTFDIAANLAVVEEELHKTRDAAEHLDYALGNFPATGDPAVKQQMREELEKLQVDLGRVRIDAPPNTLIKVDGVEIGTTPLASVYYVEPGQHVIDGQHPRLGEGESKSNIEAAHETTVSLKLAPKATDHVASSAKPVWPYLLLGGIGIVGVGVGTGLVAAAAGKSSQADSLAAGPTCHPVSTPCLDQGQGLVNDRGRFNDGAIAAFAIAGAAVIGLVIYVVVPASRKSDTALRVVPVAGPSIGGVAIAEAF
jgi:hypothetical protein